MKNLNDILSISNKELHLDKNYEFERILFKKSSRKLELYFKNDISKDSEKIIRELRKLIPGIEFALFGKEEVIKECTIDYIKEQLHQYNESCVACIEPSNIQIKENMITIYFPYKMAKETFENKGLHIKLKNDMLKSCQLECELNL